MSGVTDVRAIGDTAPASEAEEGYDSEMLSKAGALGHEKMRPSHHARLTPAGALEDFLGWHPRGMQIEDAQMVKLGRTLDTINTK